MELLNARGVRDFGPEEKILRQEVVDKLRNIFELFGFVPLETPIIERYDVMASKYAGGAEILKETFKLTDQGGRELCLRYDLTVPLCRYIGMNPQMKMPFKRYQIGRVFRDGPVKLGRYREFWQCDVDIVGASSMRADAQCLEIAQKFFSEIGLEVVLQFNNRKLLDGIMESLRIPENKRTDVILEIDKLEKIGLKGVEEGLKKMGLMSEQMDELLQILKITGTNVEKIEKLRAVVKTKSGTEGLDEIEELLKYVNAYNIEFSLTLARGLAYYTGTVFEAFLKDGNVKSSLAGGGRYDKMIEGFAGKEFPCVGISFGLEPITEEIKTKQEKVKKSTAKVFVIPIKTTEESMRVCRQLRENGINTDIDIMDRGISKNLEYAANMGITFVVIIGKKELKENCVTLRNMTTGKEEMLPLVEACAKISE